MLICFSHIWLFVTPWTVAHQDPLSMGFSRQEYWSGLPCPPPGDLPNSGTEPVSLMSPVLAYRFFTTSTTWEVCIHMSDCQSWFLKNISWHKWIKIFLVASSLYNSFSLFRSNLSNSCFLVAVVESLSRVQLFVTPWTAAHQACLSSTTSWS